MNARDLLGIVVTTAMLVAAVVVPEWALILSGVAAVLWLIATVHATCRDDRTVTAFRAARRALRRAVVAAGWSDQ